MGPSYSAGGRWVTFTGLELNVRWAFRIRRFDDNDLVLHSPGFGFSLKPGKHSGAWDKVINTVVERHNGQTSSWLGMALAGRCHWGQSVAALRSV